jgi:hypothetical protein
MNELTRRMWEYRQCLKVVWNGFFASEADFDDRDYFYNSAVELFRGIVLYLFDDDVRDKEILPAYRGDKSVFASIRVKATTPQGIQMSREGTLCDTQDLSSDVQIDRVDIRYVDLFDFYELNFREFRYVLAEIVESSTLEDVGIRLLIPFENAEFEIVSP